MRPHRFPSSYHLRLFVNDRLYIGWTRQKVIDALVTRLRLDTVDVDALDEVQRGRYDEVMRVVEGLRE